MTKEEARILFEKYRMGTCTPEERALIDRWYAAATRQRPNARLDPAGLEYDQEAILEKLQTQFFTGDDPTAPRLRRGIYRLLPYAAAVLLISAVAGYFMVVSQQPVESPVVADIPPGGNRAVLTLADGRTIDLSSEHAGIVVAEGITYLDGSQVMENDDLGMENDRASDVSITTPKGGTYQVTLPDGSKVWLNANSTLRYPSRFDGHERVVFLEGEAYFDISEQVRSAARAGSGPQKVPFRVVGGDQTIEVLGTEFNIANYPDDPATKTTLVEGTVKVAMTGGTHAGFILKPGQQATTRNAAIEINEVDANQYTAWKDGYFFFKKTPLQDVLRQVSRWYDVEVEYRNGVPSDIFGGQIKRDVTLQGLIEILQVSNIDVTLEGSVLAVH